MPRSPLTPFRKSQAKYALEGLVRWLAPAMQFPGALREVVAELARNETLWAEIADAHALEAVKGQPSTPATSSVMTAPIAGARKAWEHRCDSDDRLYLLAADETQCSRCGERRL